MTSIDVVLGIDLQKNISRDAPIPLPLHKISYSVMARQSAGRAVECNRIRARILDNKYFITNTDTLKVPRVTINVAIFDMDERALAEKKMYEVAEQIAKERATLYNATLEDLTHAPVFWPKHPK